MACSRRGRVSGHEMFPSLAAWMAATPKSHPLRELFDDAQPGDHPTSFRRMVLGAFDTIISRLEGAQPQRLGGERKDFQKARTHDELRVIRSELVAGGMLANARVSFDFGARKGIPEPDLMLRDANLSIEVKNRTLDGLRELESELAAAVTELEAPVTIYLACAERPLVIKEDVRKAIVQQTADRIQSGLRGTAVTRLEQSWATTPQLDLSVRIADRSLVQGSSRVIFLEGFQSVPGNLQDAEAAVVKALEDEQKIRQALARPTILLVDAAVTGMSSFRPPRVWAQRLGSLLPNTTPFVGIAVMIPVLTSPDAPIALATRPSADPQDVLAVQELGRDLGLEDA